MADDYKIYVDASRPATFNNGAGALTDCATLQEAVLAWQRLAPEQKIRATVKVIGGPVYTAHEMSAFTTVRSPTDDANDMKIVTAETTAELLSRAAASPRKRMNLNLHDEPTDPISRFLNAGIAGSYVRPHRHRIGKWELVSVLQGKFDLVIFTSDGVVKNRIALSSEGASVAEIPGGTWHGAVFHAPGAVILEVKPGPYEPRIDKEFASWAPPEDDPAAARFVNWIETAAPGERVCAQC